MFNNQRRDTLCAILCVIVICLSGVSGIQGFDPDPDTLTSAFQPVVIVQQMQQSFAPSTWGDVVHYLPIIAIFGLFSLILVMMVWGMFIINTRTRNI